MDVIDHIEAAKEALTQDFGRGADFVESQMFKDTARYKRALPRVQEIATEYREAWTHLQTVRNSMLKFEQRIKEAWANADGPAQVAFSTLPCRTNK